MKKISNCLEKKKKTFIYLDIVVTLKIRWTDRCCPQQVFVVIIFPIDGEVSNESLGLEAGIDSHS